MKYVSKAVFAVLLLSIFASDAQDSRREDSRSISPMEAIELAANDPVNGVTATFEFTVRGTGKQGRFFYLNSEKDYRDQRCLTVRLSRGNAAGLGKKHGISIRDGLIGRHVLVHGTAKREQIFITNAGPRSGLYYYQTHIYVDSLDQIEILDGA